MVVALGLLTLLAATPTDTDAALKRFTEETQVVVRCALKPCPDWTIDALEDLRAGLNRLPSELRGAPLSIILHRNERPFGMGDGSRRAPDFDEHGFHLYAVGPNDERRASWRTATLSESERIHLWRQRAIVHAVIEQRDALLQLSARPSWLRLSGWSEDFTGTTAANVFPGAYSRTRGMQSPAEDFATFAEEHFVPVEALKPDALATDDQVRCQELSKSRVLHSLLFEAKLIDAPYERPRCPAFEGWAALDRLDSLEVLLVASSGKRPESLFGHLLLRPVHRQGAVVQGKSFESAIQLAAITDGEAAGPVYLYRGIFGGYRSAVFTLSWRDVEREVLDGEQRTIRRFKLRLSELERVRLMERVFELERRGYYDYRFFTQNCATLAAQLVESALDEHTSVTMTGTLLVSPTSALDSLAAIRREGPDGSAPLLERLNGDFEPSGVIADRAETGRLRDEELVTDTHLRSLLIQARSTRLPERLGALRELASRPPANPAEAAMLYRWWLNAVRVERYRVDLARTDLRKLDLSTLLPGTPPSTEVQVAERQQSFERETVLDARMMELDRADAAAQWLQHAPRRPLTEAEVLRRAQLEAQVDAFDEVTFLQGSVIDRDFAATEPKAVLADERVELELEQQAWAARAEQGSGTWRSAGGAGISFAGRPQLRLESAGMRELIGDQRIRGLASSTELHVLDAEATFNASTHAWPEVAQSRFTLFGWRSLGRVQPTLRRTLFEHFGYGFSATTDYLRERALSTRVRLDGEAFALLDASADLERHLALGVALRGELDWANWQTFGAGGGPRAVLLQRVPLGGRASNALRLEASWGPRWLTADEARFAHEIQLSAQADVHLEGFGHAALIRPELSLTVDAPQHGAPIRTGMFTLMFEPLGRLD